MSALGFLQSVIEELPVWLLTALGFSYSLRVLRFPDLTIEASFAAGTAAAFFAATRFGDPVFGWPLAIVIGAVCGSLTGAIYGLHSGTLFKLLAGLLVSFSFFSVNYRLLDHQASQRFVVSESSIVYRPGAKLFALYVFVLLAVLIVSAIHRSTFGFALRTAATRQVILKEANRNPSYMLLVGLAIANACVALAGWTQAVDLKTADSKAGSVVLHALAAVVVGDIACNLFASKSMREPRSLRWLLAPPLIGALLYIVFRAITIELLTQKQRPDPSTTWVFTPAEFDLDLIFSLMIVLLIFLRRALSPRFASPAFLEE